MDQKNLRNQAIEDILQELDKFLLTRQSFKYTFNNKNGEIAKFEYKDNPKFHFIIKQLTKTNEWQTKECPSNYFTSAEEFVWRNFGDCRSRIFGWVQRIVQEITTKEKNTSKVIQNLRDNLERNINDLENPDDPFNNEEASHWIDRINDTFKQLESVREKLKIQESELKQLKTSLDDLKENIYDFPKKTWLRKVGNQLLNIFEKASVEITKSVAEGVVKGLLSSQK